jgi:hypothetical protein
MKANTTKSEPKTETPKAIEAIGAIAEVVIAFRANGKPSLADLVKIASRAAVLLKLDGDEKAGIENAATMQIAKKHGLVS